MNFSVLFSFAGSLVWFCGAGGLLFVIVGFVMYRRASLRRPLKGTASEIFRGELQRRRIPEAAMADYSYSLQLFNALVCVGVGVGSLLFTIVYIIVLASPLWNILCVFNFGKFSLSIWFLFCIAGASAAGYYAFCRLHRAALVLRDGGPRRQLRDYRSPLVRLIPGGWLVLICTVLLVFHPSYMPMNDCLNSDFFYRTPWQGWFVYPWLGVALILLLSIEMLLSRVAMTRSPLVPTNIPGTTAIDDMLRAKIINMTQGMGFMLMMGFSTPLASFVASGYFILITLPFLILVFLFLALILMPSTGLGGRLTGWFWKRQGAS